MSDGVAIDRSRVVHTAILVAILAAAILLRVYEFRGFGASDDAAYAELAGRVARGEPLVGAYDGPPAFPLRIGIIHPTAMLFGAFGVHEWTMVGFNFVVSLLGVLLAYACARHFFGREAGIAAAAVWALLPLDAFHASILVPDPPSALFLGAAILLTIWLLARGSSDRLHLLGGGIVVGLLLGYSWLCKEAVAYAVPFYVFLIVRERTRLRDVWGLWAGIAAGSAAVLFGEALVYHGVTGDWLFHLHETERNYLENPAAFAVQRPGTGDGYLGAVVRRVVFTGPWSMLLNPRLGYLPLLGLLAAAYALFRRDRRYLVPIVWLVSLALMFNFASSSTREYVPLLLFDRYLYPLLLPATVLVAGLLASPFDEAYPSSPELRRERRFWSGALALFMFGAYAWQNREYRYVGTGWTEEVEVVSGLVQPSDRIYTDAHSIFGLDFHWGYPDDLNAVNFEDVAPTTDFRPGDYVLVNHAYLAHLERYSGWWPTQSNPFVPPDFAVDPPSDWEVVWSNGNGTLYGVR